MINWLHHWIYQDIFVPVWPNWFASGSVGILALIWGRRRIKELHAKLDRNHEATKKIHEHLNIK